MRLFILLAGIFVVMTSEKCNKKTAGDVYKARVEVTGMCSNITIKVLDEKVDTSLVQADWTDETTGIAYKNVFALGNPCAFPTIKKGDEFYFIIDTAKQKDCIVCMAYYPVPEKRLTIKQVDKP